MFYSHLTDDKNYICYFLLEKQSLCNNLLQYFENMKYTRAERERVFSQVQGGSLSLLHRWNQMSAMKPLKKPSSRKYGNQQMVSLNRSARQCCWQCQAYKTQISRVCVSLLQLEEHMLLTLPPPLHNFSAAAVGSFFGYMNMRVWQFSVLPVQKKEEEEATEKMLFHKIPDLRGTAPL